MSVDSWLFRGRLAALVHLLHLDYLGSELTGQASGCHLRGCGLIRCLWGTDCLCNSACRRSAWSGIMAVAFHHRRKYIIWSLHHWFVVSAYQRREGVVSHKERERCHERKSHPRCSLQRRRLQIPVAILQDGLDGSVCLGCWNHSIQPFGCTARIQHLLTDHHSRYGVSLPSQIQLACTDFDPSYTALQANYLTIPVYTFGSMIVVLVAFLSDRLRVRSFLLAGITIPGIVGYAMIIASGNRIVGYVATYLCAGGMSFVLTCATRILTTSILGLLSFSTVFFTWIVINISPEYKRSVALGLVTTMVNCSGLVGPQIYLPRDTPRYVMGNAVSMSCEIAALTGVGIMYFMLRSRNAKKVKLLAEGVTENGKEGDEALGFAFLL